MIKVQHLTRRYGAKTAVDDVTFRVEAGEIVGFLGPNGAGKTTTLRILAGFLPATGGTVEVAGFDVFRDSLEVRRRIGYLPEHVPLYPELRVVEYLRHRGRLKGLYRRALRRAVDGVLEACGLCDVRRTLIGRLSKGYRQRVGLADSLLGDPEVLILDEPTIGLDPNQIRQVRGLIKGLAGRHTVLLSSHILPEVESVCQRVLIISAGRIVASDTPRQLAGVIKGNIEVVAEIQGPCDAVAGRLAQLPGVLAVRSSVADGWGLYTCECERTAEVRPLIYRTVTENAWQLRELRRETRRLEDVFVAITTEGGTADTGGGAT